MQNGYIFWVSSTSLIPSTLKDLWVLKLTLANLVKENGCHRPGTVGYRVSILAHDALDRQGSNFGLLFLRASSLNESTGGPSRPENNYAP